MGRASLRSPSWCPGLDSAAPWRVLPSSTLVFNGLLILPILKHTQLSPQAWGHWIPAWEADGR